MLGLSISVAVRCALTPTTPSPSSSSQVTSPIRYMILNGTVLDTILCDHINAL
jgi:hypothetical protein